MSSRLGWRCETRCRRTKPSSCETAKVALLFFPAGTPSSILGRLPHQVFTPTCCARSIGASSWRKWANEGCCRNALFGVLSTSISTKSNGDLAAAYAAACLNPMYMYVIKQVLVPKWLRFLTDWCISFHSIFPDSPRRLYRCCKWSWCAEGGLSA